jgi:hypothetical protein
MSENPDNLSPDDLSVLGFFYSQEKPKGSPIPTAEIGALEEKLAQQLTLARKDFFRSRKATTLSEREAIENANPKVKIELELNDLRALDGYLRRLSQLEESERKFSIVRAYWQQAYKAFRDRRETNFRKRVGAALRLLEWTKGKKQSRYDAFEVVFDYLSEVQKETEQDRIRVRETIWRRLCETTSKLQSLEDIYALWEKSQALMEESQTLEPTTRTRWKAIETVVERHHFPNKKACHQFLKENGVDRLPRLPSTWPAGRVSKQE